MYVECSTADQILGKKKVAFDAVYIPKPLVTPTEFYFNALINKSCIKVTNKNNHTLPLRELTVLAVYTLFAIHVTQQLIYEVIAL